MRSFLSILGVLFSINCFAANPLQKYLGCYEVVSFNGVTKDDHGVAAILNGPGTVMRYVEDPNTHESIPAINVTVYAINPVIDPVVYWPYDISALNDRGVYTSDAAGDHYHFDGVLREDDLSTVHSRLDIKRQSDQTLQVSFSWDEVTEKGERFASVPTLAALKERPDWFDSSTGKCHIPLGQ